MDVFQTITKLAKEVGESWTAYGAAIAGTRAAEDQIAKALAPTMKNGSASLLSADCSLVLFGSFARYEFVDGSDYDWSLLVDGVVDNDHADAAEAIRNAITKAKLPQPGSSGTFGNMVFSHDLVHRIGGGADSNLNLTRRMLMLLESRSFNLNDDSCYDPVWDNVLSNILERYFEEDVHFAPKGKRKVPRFLLNDLTRYWRTIGVDYAAKHREQGEYKWAARNAKLRFSRKLLYAAGLAFCLSCQLDPPSATHTNLFGDVTDETPAPFIERAKEFARIPPLEFLAAFLDTYVKDSDRRKKVAVRIFGAYNEWLTIWGDKAKREEIEAITHDQAPNNQVFQQIRDTGSDFARGLEMLFFDRDRDIEKDSIAALTLQYIGF